MSIATIDSGAGLVLPDTCTDGLDSGGWHGQTCLPVLKSEDTGKPALTRATHHFGCNGAPVRAGDAENAIRKLRTGDAPDVLRKLRAKLEDYNRRRAGWRRRFIPTGLTPLDAVLPHGGLPCGAVTEIFFDGPGVGAMSLAMRVAARCIGWGRYASSAGLLEDQQSIVLVDTFKDSYPPGVSQYGIALDRLIVIRTMSEKDAFWAVDQSLRCLAVAAVIAPLTKIDERLSRRLQLAAQSSGCIGLILQSADRRIKSFAAVQMLVEGVTRANQFARATPRANDSYLCRITLLRVREGTPTEPFLVDLHHETSALSLHPVPVDRSAAKFA